MGSSGKDDTSSTEKNNEQTPLRGKIKKPSLAAIKYGKEIEKTNVPMLRADRCVGNLLEQLLPFLVSLYGHAVFVNVSHATKLGWAWILFRSYYGIPAYACIWWMLGTAVYKASTYHQN